MLAILKDVHIITLDGHFPVMGCYDRLLISVEQGPVV
jgi:hypothetical protein